MRRVRIVLEGREAVDRRAEQERRRRRRMCRPRKAEEMRWAVMMVRPLAQGGVDSLPVKVICCLIVLANLVSKVRNRNVL